jgi:hypothetical protein
VCCGLSQHSIQQPASQPAAAPRQKRQQQASASVLSLCAALRCALRSRARALFSFSKSYGQVLRVRNLAPSVQNQLVASKIK